MSNDRRPLVSRFDHVPPNTEMPARWHELDVALTELEKSIDFSLYPWEMLPDMRERRDLYTEYLTEAMAIEVKAGI